MSIQQELTLFLNQQGIQSVGFAHLEQEDINLLKQCNMDFGDCSYGISIAVKLSDAIIDEITDAPTHTYFHHYRTVNTFIDQTLLKLGIYLEQKGYRYITVGASQSINLNGWNYNGRYSHKKLACLAAQLEKVRCFFIKNTEPEYVWEVYLPTVRYRFKITRLFLFVKIVLYVPTLVQVVQYPVKNGTLVSQEKKFFPLKHAVNI